MNMQFLETFLMVAEYKNFTKAAEKLHISQPTASWQIKELERELNVPLFERNQKAVRLSEDGERFLPLASHVLMEWEKAIEVMAEKGNTAKIIKIGCPEMIAISVISDVIKEMFEESKSFSVEVSTGVFSNLIQRLMRREVDYIYIFNKRMSMDGLRKLFEKEGRVVFACAPSHPLANQKCVLRDLENYTFFLPYIDEVTSYVYKLKEYFENENINIASLLRIGSVTTIRDMVLDGMGIALFPDVTIRKELEAKKLVELEIENVNITMWHQVFCLENKWLSEWDTIFCQKIKKELKID